MFNPNEIDYTLDNRIIVLKNVYGSLTKTYVQPAIDESSGQLLGVKLYSEDAKKTVPYYATGESRRELSNGCTFNLNLYKDRVDWEWVKYCPMIALTKQEAIDYATSYEFYIHDEERETSKRLERAELEYRALQYVMNTPMDKLQDKARLLNERIENLSPMRIKEHFIGLLKDEDPRKLLKLIRIYEDNTSEHRLLLFRLTDRNVINYTQGVYYFGDLMLGQTEEQVIAYMKDVNNQEIYNTLVLKAYPEIATNSQLKRILTQLDNPIEETKEEDSSKSKSKK